MNLFNSDRCKICKKRKGHRFCIRQESNICWQDCNILRIDLTCPESCRYSLKKNEKDDTPQLFEYKTKADSRAEFTDLLKKEIDKWIITPQSFLEDKTPLQLAETETGRQQITSFFQGFKIPQHIPLDYLKQRLDLKDLNIKTSEPNFEDIVFTFLDNIITLEWDNIIDLVFQNEKFKDSELKENYLRRLSSDKVLKRLKYYNIISSALSEDRKTALVGLELNGKYELTVVVKKHEGNWRVAGRIYGKPELYNGENEAIKQVAIKLSANKTAEVFPLLKKYTAIYPDSSDLHYYWGLYYTFTRNTEQAREYFLNAVELDPNFLEAKYNYAYVLHSTKKIDRAKAIYQEILRENPEDVKTLNNLASIYIDAGEYTEARKLLEKCLKLDASFSVAEKNLQRLKELD